MEIKGLGFYPLFLTFWCIAWLTTSYLLAVISGHSPALIYISESGDEYPEIITFKIGFLVMSIGALGLTYLHYKFMMFHCEAFGTCQPLIQELLLAIGLFSCFGIAVMALFSSASNLIIHLFGAGMAFGFAAIYNLWQSINLYKVPGSHRVTCRIRTVFCTMTIICLLMTVGSQAADHIDACDRFCVIISKFIGIISEWLALVLILTNMCSYFHNLQVSRRLYNYLV
ncbi:DNA damage-regulated autophagy modulator protein 1-like [Anomaloglossus baeobatrachus]|uniref:DNA damage-regulated autophagy modulator protein 1-like n=1 Tax=Anomaloglossus baeobatrachus TaxID=238106 RepID=UPI003F4FD55A